MAFLEQGERVGGDADLGGGEQEDATDREIWGKRHQRERECPIYSKYTKSAIQGNVRVLFIQKIRKTPKIAHLAHSRSSRRKE